MMSRLPAPEVMVGAVPPGQIVPAGQPAMVKAPVLEMTRRTLPVVPAAGQLETLIEVIEAVRESAQFSPRLRLTARLAPDWVTVWTVRSAGPPMTRPPLSVPPVSGR